MIELFPFKDQSAKNIAIQIREKIRNKSNSIKEQDLIKSIFTSFNLFLYFLKLWEYKRLCNRQIDTNEIYIRDGK